MTFRHTGDLDPCSHGLPGGLSDANGYPDRRLFVWGTGAALLTRVAPTAGGPADGVSLATHPDPGSPGSCHLACTGVPVLVEAGAAFSTGVSLETLVDGRVKAVVSGKAVMRSLQSSGGAGAVVWAVFL